jgi:hypothetical protein
MNHSRRRSTDVFLKQPISDNKIVGNTVEGMSSDSALIVYSSLFPQLLKPLLACMFTIKMVILGMISGLRLPTVQYDVLV